MPDIFVSYARQDREQVRALAARLETFGWTVWWDRQILAGTDYDVVIERALDAARAVVVVWSKHSVASRWVKTEATEGLKREVLIPIILDDSAPPLAFRNIQSVAFGGGSPSAGSAAFDELIESLTSLLGTAPREVPAVPQPPREEPVATAAPAAPPAASAEPRPLEVAPTPPPLPILSRLRVPLMVLGLIVLGQIAWWGYRAATRDAQAPAAAATPQAPASAPQAKPAEPPPLPPAGQPKVEPTPAATEPAGQPSDITRAEAEALVRDFIAAVNAGDEERMLTFYADRVDYFAQGQVGRDQIRQDRQAYRRRWPEITLGLVGDIAVRDSEPPGKTLVTFASTYQVGSATRNARAGGTLESTFALVRVGGAPRIVDQKEVSRSDRR